MNEKILDINSIPRLFLSQCQKALKKNAIGWIENDQLRFYTFQEYKNIIESLALGLHKLGFNKNHTAIIGNTSKEWHFLDMATLCMGGVVVPVYPNLPALEIVHLIHHSDSTVLIIEDDLLFETIINHLNDFSKIKLIITLNELSENNLKKIRNSINHISYIDLLNMGSNYQQLHPDLFEAFLKVVKPEDIASIIYTSGTTGEPKGAVLTHESFVTMLKNVKSFVKGAFNSNDRTLTFLPLSHVFGRCDSFLPLIFGWEMVFARSTEKVIDDLQIVKPTIMLSVPRILEKIYNKIQSHIHDSHIIQKNVFDWAIKASTTYFDKIEKDKTPSYLEIIEEQISFKLVFEKIYQMFGGRIRFFVSGGAPISKEVITFLRNAKLTILEGYGLTETAAPIFLNPVNKQIPGTVGRPIGDVKIKFNSDNEILIHSKALFKNYYKNEESTQDSFENSWFKTGDIGYFTIDGFLIINDRKKDIIITSTGKNIAPSKIESQLQTCQSIKQAAVFGDKHSYLVALIAPNFEYLKSKIPDGNHLTQIEFSSHHELIEVVQHDINSINSKLSNFEGVKKFKIIPIEFNVNNYLTPSMKIKRKKLYDDFKGEIDALYADNFDN
jgi:long-chain acyl-CoA synthetase